MNCRASLFLSRYDTVTLSWDQTAPINTGTKIDNVCIFIVMINSCLLNKEGSIEDALNQPDANPELGRWRTEISSGYYSFPARKHIIFYLNSGCHIDIK